MAGKKISEETRRLKDNLAWEQQRVWDKLSEKERREVFPYAQGYMDFLDQARTERRAVSYFVERGTKAGFRDISSGKAKGKRWFQVSRGKLMGMATLGRKPMTEGLRIVTSHVDAPRLDLKPNPLYEETGLSLMKTHYYGGIKKYHWVARSLAICGTVIRKDGTVADVEIGLDPKDPVFSIPDLLPHLSRKQMEQKANEFIPAENLNVIVGGLPYHDTEAEERVKLATLQWLHARYGITEEDFTTAEIEVIPAEPARDMGLDRSLVAAYGQDDRVCAYTSFTALAEVASPDHTAVAIFYDKEEIGSEGNTSARSNLLEMFVMELMHKTGIEPNRKNFHKVFFNSRGLSADVAAGLDPTYQDVSEKRNSCRLGHGINLKKFTGSGGKYAASDANAEYAAWVRRLFNEHGIVWQAGSMGKVDEGGGGTVAKFLAGTGMEIIDCGPPILGMHSPLEVSSKEDVWMCFKAFRVFLGS